MTEDCFQEILDIYDSLPKQQKKIADFVLTSFSEVIYFSVGRMASAIGVSAASIVRFTRMLGFEGFSDFQEAFFEYHKKIHSPRGRVQQLIKDFDNTEINYRNITKREIRYLEKSIHLIDDKTYWAAVNLLCKAQKVHILGMGPNEMLGCHLSFRLRRFSVDTFHHKHGDSMLAEELLRLSRQDAAVAYNFFRISDELKIYVDIMKKKEVPVILITDIMNPAIIKDCSFVFCAERGPQGSFHSPLVPLAITNALLVGVAYKLDKKALQSLELLETYRQKYYYNKSGEKYGS
ncbi:MurR/RpiR family transcriptional regulator [Treponema sp. HNW]|uniref:MurR/RpiR family transcriptional regulator n=1 Tax=Treponema sp. HNW TaxID=3116654 RepID=UPI003D147B31